MSTDCSTIWRATPRVDVIAPADDTAGSAASPAAAAMRSLRTTTRSQGSLRVGRAARPALSTSPERIATMEPAVEVREISRVFTPRRRDPVTALAGVSLSIPGGEVPALIGIVFGGERGLYTRLSARQNLEYWGALYRLSGPQIKARSAALLERVGL